MQRRLTVILGLILAVSGLMSLLILRVAIAPAFSTLETRNADTDLGRAALAIDSQLQQLRAIVGDWAPWDEPYAFAQGDNPDFVWRNIDLNTLRNIEIELMQFFDVDGRILWSGYVEQGEFAEIEALGRLGDGDPLYGLLTGHDHPDDAVSGLLMTNRGPMLLVSLPLVEEAGMGPIAGTIVMGRLLTDDRRGTLIDHIKVPFDIVPIDEAVSTMPATVEQLEAAAAGTPVHTVDETDIRSFRLLNDISGNPLGVLQSRTPRAVTAIGQNAADLALLLFVGTSVLVVALLWFFMRRDIVGPLERLTAHMGSIRVSGDLSARITPHRNDEIGHLAHEFNALTGELQQVRRQLVEQSFKAGRADTAADVMHNIRNAMTPIVNVADNLSEALQKLNGLRLRRATEDLADPACTAERRDRLLSYIAAAGDRIGEAESEAAADVDVIRSQAKLVDEIVAGQEAVLRVAPVQESVDLAEAVSEAVTVLPAKGGADLALRVAPELAGLTVTANRVQLLQIVGNLVLNAYEAAERAGSKPARIDIFTGAATRPELIRLSIRDNGAGLAQDQLTRIFQPGYSSKARRHGGLGLHWCANALKSLGGGIEVESAGAGTGATVHIELPAARRESSHRQRQDQEARVY